MEESPANQSSGPAIAEVIAANVKLLRGQAGMTLAELAAAADLGKSTLAQLESGRANPSVETLWALAAALHVPFARLIEDQRPPLRVVRAADVPAMRSVEAPGWAGRLLTTGDRRGSFDLYAIDLARGSARHADAHQAGVVEHLVTVTGRLRAGPLDATVELGPGDMVTFAADVPHLYEALEDCHLVLLMSYP